MEPPIAPQPQLSEGRPTFTPPEPAALEASLPGYDITRLLAQGGMGAVYQARQQEPDRPVAIKILPKDIGLKYHYPELFAAESAAMARLHHPNIVRHYDFGETEDGFLYLVMELVVGTDLHKVIHLNAWFMDQKLELLVRICDALAHAHQKDVIHRDIKPANILIGQDDMPKVCDFGLARIGSGEIDDSILGTMGYSAPEQLTKGAKMDHRVDVFSLGALIYETLTGAVPDDGFELPSTYKLDPRFDKLILKALQQKPEDRFQSAKEVREALQSIRDNPTRKLNKHPGNRKTPSTKTAPLMSGSPKKPMGKPMAAGKVLLPPQGSKKVSPLIIGLAVVGVLVLMVILFAFLN